MKNSEYVKTLGDVIEKDDLLATVDALQKGITKVSAIVRYWDGISTSPGLTKKDLRTNKGVNERLRGVKRGRSLPATLVKIDINFKVNLDSLSDVIRDEFPEQLIPGSASVKEIVVLTYLSALKLINNYSSILAVEQMKAVVAETSTSDVFLPVRKDTKMLENTRMDFRTAVDVLGKDPKDFKETLKNTPVVPATDDNIEILTGSTGFTPVASRFTSGFIRPILSIRRFFLSVENSYIRWMEDRLMQAKIVRDSVLREIETNTSPAAERELELLEDEIATLEYDISKRLGDD